MSIRTDWIGCGTQWRIMVGSRLSLCERMLNARSCLLLVPVPLTQSRTRARQEPEEEQLPDPLEAAKSRNF